MRICFVTTEFVTEPSCFDGGLANYLYRVSLSLIQLGHEPIVIITSTTNEIFKYNNIEVHRVLIPENKNSYLLNSLKQSYIISDYLHKVNIRQPLDIIQYTSLTALGIFRLSYIPSVIRISSYHPLLVKNYNFEMDILNQYLTQIEVISLKISDGVYGPSKIISELIKSSEGIDVKVIETPYINDVSTTDESLYNKYLGNIKYLLFFGTIGILKGAAIIADIIFDLLSKHIDLYFVFVGKDAGYNDKTMMSHIYEKAGVHAGRIIRFDKISHELLYPVIKGSHAVVLPSRIDNFPNTCIESMALGKIVIGTHQTGFDQLITDGINGFLCEKDNPDDLLRTIEKLLSLSEMERKIVQNNAIECIKLLSPENVVNELIEYYKDIISKFNADKNVKISEVNNQLMRVFWAGIQNLEEHIDLTEKTIQKQDRLISQICNSYSYRIGHTLLKPFRFIRNYFKNRIN